MNLRHNPRIVHIHNGQFARCRQLIVEVHRFIGVDVETTLPVHNRPWAGHNGRDRRDIDIRGVSGDVNVPRSLGEVAARRACVGPRKQPHLRRNRGHQPPFFMKISYAAPLNMIKPA